MADKSFQTFKRVLGVSALLVALGVSTSAVTASEIADNLTGDLRLRVERTNEVKKVATKYRFRVGSTANVDEKTEVGFRLATGTAASPQTSTNEEFNGLQNGTLNIDRAYAKYSTGCDLDMQVTAGRFQPTFYNPTDLLWDEDINWDGAAASFKVKNFSVNAALIQGGNAYESGLVDSTTLAVQGVSSVNLMGRDVKGAAAVFKPLDDKNDSIYLDLNGETSVFGRTVYADVVYNTDASDDGLAASLGVKGSIINKVTGFAQFRYFGANAWDIYSTDADAMNNVIDTDNDVLKSSFATAFEVGAAYALTDKSSVGADIYLINDDNSNNELLIQFDYNVKF